MRPMPIQPTFCVFFAMKNVSCRGKRRVPAGHVRSEHPDDRGFRRSPYHGGGGLATRPTRPYLIALLHPPPCPSPTRGRDREGGSSIQIHFTNFANRRYVGCASSRMTTMRTS